VTNKSQKTFKEKIEYFLYEDDSFKATAGKFLLATLALGGVVFAGAVLPGLMKATRGSRNFHRYKKKQIKSAFSNLRRRKLVEIVSEKNDRVRIKLTNKGLKRVKEFSIESLAIQKPTKWDKKWRAVIFDIPTRPKRLNTARAALREKIRELGFYKLQHSVWIHPYPCEDEILLVSEIFEVTSFVEILTVEKLLHEAQLKIFFNL